MRRHTRTRMRTHWLTQTHLRSHSRTRVQRGGGEGQRKGRRRGGGEGERQGDREIKTILIEIGCALAVLWLVYRQVQSKRREGRRGSRCACLQLSALDSRNPKVRYCICSASGNGSCCLDLSGELRGHHGNTARKGVGQRGSSY